MRTLTFRRPDDWHVHFRDGAAMRAVVPYTTRAFGRAIVMPNLTPPVTTTALAAAYRERIRAAVPEGMTFTPLMTAYLTDGSDPTDIVSGFGDGVLTAVKLYPAHATTNSQFGVTSMAAVAKVLAAMEKAGMPLLVHGEVTRTEVDVFDREARFVEEVLAPLLADFPALKIVLEHVTTAEGVAIVRENASRMAGTMTPQHLLFDRNEIFRGGIRPHMYCLPILKRSTHKQALRAAATSGESCFFLGTDTAPHLRHLKENACGCAGVFSAPTAIEAYLKVFAEENALDRFEAFASLNGPAFYGLPANDERVTWVEQPRLVAEAVEVEGQGEIVSLFAGETVGWSPATA